MIKNDYLNNFEKSFMEKERIELLHLETGVLWPHYKKKKAWSANALTRILKEIEYGDKGIPEHVLQRAAENGKIFHRTIQNFVQTRQENFAPTNSLNVNKKIKETINFLKSEKLLNFSHFLGSEKLHYAFHENELLATYIDLEFEDYIIELKTNNAIINESPISLLVFEVQLLIQHLCTGKKIYLL
jgi:hypothetical protein